MSSKIPVAISFSGVANLLGVVGVIGSLIFVGLELRQTQRIATVVTSGKYNYRK
jgi:FtsH-binding integral membrane protein